jgi:hypothetical protein
MANSTFECRFEGVSWTTYKAACNCFSSLHFHFLHLTPIVLLRFCGLPDAGTGGDENCVLGTNWDVDCMAGADGDNNCDAGTDS